ncbi:hypothetical protein JH06_4702 [Blastocystis sp. subtype 4]|uniref:hypothetical protein n=1 Tax=Blastocystis sp. subtype 4 TaxID=944170 RepID=UPI0007119FC7|nr:hypothetical protein JH06_4702 [Blastocystis sp. subtype 4]KNB41803.1 hypothetical protein JH06_4702 [Blastocystis sp. subtype 4]|eukprot:XP_014525246.1 hypothetical protein JH06_4702 [Blastocystis sp. subtype 4]
MPDKKVDDYWTEDMDPRKKITYEVVYPDSFEFVVDYDFSRDNVEVNPIPAKTYSYKLDPFQRKSIDCLERKESVLVSAHTSAGKTAIAEYAIAMSLRDHQRVIYTSPIKALSNQKYRDLEQEFSDVGLMTGDVTISPNATVLVMTTEILRSMLYKGSDILREVAWVIYDEIHYMRDKERGVVWEESIILLPDSVRFVFLSATIPNARDFAGWIAKIHNQKVNVVYTEYRPVPLQHYLFPVGGDGLFLVIDDKGNFREQNFTKALSGLTMSTLESQINEDKKKRSKKPTDDLQKIVSLVMERNLDPVIVFSFSKKDCEAYALLMAKMDFTSTDEKKLIADIYKNAISSLNNDDRNLPQVKSVLPLLVRGVGIHHGGLLPIIKETIEILFQEGLLKILFATETFAMGINMPAKTCIFTSLRKYDGEEYRMITSGEYIQMSGRAGRRNKDAKGIVIQIVDEVNQSDGIKHILTGKADPLFSSFHLGYNMLLNLLRVENADPEYMIRKSFFQYQNELVAPRIQKEIDELQTRIDSIHVENEKMIFTVYQMRQAAEKLNLQIHAIEMTPKYILPFLQNGRLIHDGHNDYGWGAIVCFNKNKDYQENETSVEAKYVIDVAIKCSERSTLASLIPPETGKVAKVQVTQIFMNCIEALSSIRIFMPKDLRPATNRATVEKTVAEVVKRYNGNVPCLDPKKDIKIEDETFDKLLTNYERLIQRLSSLNFDLNNEANAAEYHEYEKKMELTEQLTNHKKDIQKAKELVLTETLQKMKRVLRRLGYLDDGDVVQAKGRVACEINSADEILITELIYDGVFIDLSPQQCVALLASIVFQEKDDETVKVRAEMQPPYNKLKETARRVATVFNECKLPVDVDEYVNALKPTMLEIVYEWASGSKFSDICKLTTIFEGTIIRCIRRLDELIQEVQSALLAIGDKKQAEKFEEGSKLIKRDIVFAASLYL